MRKSKKRTAKESTSVPERGASVFCEKIHKLLYISYILLSISPLRNVDHFFAIFRGSLSRGGAET
jgi:hypothetical protein